VATTALDGTPAHTCGELPAVGEPAPAFTLVGSDLRELSLADLTGRVVVSIFPSVGTGVCQAGVRRFNELAGQLPGTTVLNVSMDLPFALAGFCAAEGLANVTTGSAFRSTFGDDYGVRLTDSAFEGLLARAVVLIDADGTVLHTQLVDDIAHEPDYDAAIAALR
jgi:thiol peroxidase